MEGQHWSTTGWTFGDRFNVQKLHSVCPYPDWPNFGPSLVFENDNFIGEQQPLSCKSNSYRFQSLKSSGGAFPLKKSFSFAYPLSFPSNAGNSANFWNNVAVDQYRGNCLDVLKMGEEISVVCPNNKDGNYGINIYRLESGSNIIENDVSYNHIFYRLEKHAGFISPFPAYHIVAKYVNNTAYVLTRSEKQTGVFSLSGSSSKGKFYQRVCSKTSTLTGADISDVLPGHYAVASENGRVFVKDVCSKSSDVIWECSFQEEMTSKKCSFHCEFGRHPLSVLVNNKSSLWLCDTRISGQTSNSCKRLLLNTNCMKKFISGTEEISVFSQCEGLPYLYVITSKGVLVYDERYNKTPNMMWQHRLKNVPSFVTKQKFGDSEAVMLSGKENNEVCIILNDWIHSDSASWCRSKSLPKHFNIAQDTINFTHSEEISITHEAYDRVSSNCIGLASFIPSKNENEMCLLNLNKYGDVFSQHFKLSDSSDEVVNKEDIEIGKKILSRWQDHVNSTVQKAEQQQYIEGSQFLQKLVKRDSVIATSLCEMFMGLPDFAIDEEECTNESTSENIWDLRLNIKKVKKGKQSQQKQKEWLQSLVDEYLIDDSVQCRNKVSLPKKKHKQIDRYFPRKIANAQKTDFSNAPKDPLTTKLFTPWTENIPAGRGFHYHTAPLAFNRMSHIPVKMKHLVPLESNDLDFEDMYESSAESVDEPLYTSQAALDDSQHFQVSQILSQQIMKIQKKKAKKRRVDGF
ncbi:uncharacterized protein LOC119594082 [Penaeus monodon]|uniref:uncharacterized protein LOC119594082 n=1 Tax=Penaeus monodon TaxID=6687 RepID=UPI0018A75314|nr:uncharacterized protein LOC119594082 [Penaeus monodon]